MKKFVTLILAITASFSLFAGEKTVKSKPFGPDECVIATKINGDITFKVYKKTSVKEKLGKIPEGNESVVCSDEIKKAFSLPVGASCELQCNPMK